ncbi:Rv1355c family protein [Nocardia huaxiensis]|uniref:Rv1355c family protein n=1 Tax=Nocardia huaxiensis TaxID=2755382 RepID=UPI001FD2D440|nr:Rv1355c family protein [Nocardia huaxiensis]
MTVDHCAAWVYRPLLLDEFDLEDNARLAELRAGGRVEFSDLRGLLRHEFDLLVAPPEISEGPESDRWVYYPWRRAAVAVLGPRHMRTLRLDRNRNNLTRAEQDLLGRQSIGVVGQSVGHAVAHTLALEGLCGRLRLADFDSIELTNLNRVPGTLFDLGVNKAVATARRIAELDPYLPIEIVTDPLDEANMDAFLDGLTLVVEECDSLDVKLAVREAARRHRLPLLMQSSDRGLLDVERFDLEPARRPFHGLLGDTTTADLRGLSTRDKAPHVIRIIDGRTLSDRLAASMVEIGETLNSWPQLGGEVQLGGATVAAAVRRLGLGRDLPSGRIRIDLDNMLDDLTEPMPSITPAWADSLTTGTDAEPALTARTGESARVRDGKAADDVEDAQVSGITAVLHCAQRAPSGGNAQPWTLRADAESITISLASERSSAMDIGFRGSALALGAAWYNARVAAAALGLLDPSELRPRAGIGSEGMPRAGGLGALGGGSAQTRRGVTEPRIRTDVFLGESPKGRPQDYSDAATWGRFFDSREQSVRDRDLWEDTSSEAWERGRRDRIPGPEVPGSGALRGFTDPEWPEPFGGDQPPAVGVDPRRAFSSVGPRMSGPVAWPGQPLGAGGRPEWRGSGWAGSMGGELRPGGVSLGLRPPHENGLRAGGSTLLSAVVRLGDCTDSVLARDYSALLARHTNRRFGTGAPIPGEVLETLAEAAQVGGGGLRWVTGRAEIDTAAQILAEAERIRCLTPRLHQEMFAELRGPGDDLRTGLDVRTLELAPGELAVLEIARRADVMGRIRAWSGGTALGRHTGDQVRSSSAVAVVTLAAPPPADPYELVAYARAGEALQRVWARAQRHGLAVQPVSPVFLYARRPEELHTVSPEFADTLTSLQGRFLDLLGVPGHETVALVLRLGYAAEVTVRSRRLPVPDAETRG